MPKSTRRKPRGNRPSPIRTSPYSPCHRQVGKKVRGRFHYFGKVADDPDGQKALELWLAQKDDLLAGRKPRPAGRARGSRWPTCATTS